MLMSARTSLHKVLRGPYIGSFRQTLESYGRPAEADIWSLVKSVLKVLCDAGQRSYAGTEVKKNWLNEGKLTATSNFSDDEVEEVDRRKVHGKEKS
jgi:hypothetical protein